MGDLKQTLAKGVEDGKIPHAVVCATNKDGSFTYNAAVGKAVLGQDVPIKDDAVFLLASQTKLVASIAALQVVDQGLIGLDDDVAPHLPEIANQPILEGFDDDGKPLLKEREKTITLKHLLTHSAGMAYNAGEPKLIRYAETKGQTPNTGVTVTERFNYPLLYEPGTSWCYSPGIDWAGKVVERLTGETLEVFMKKNIWAPLGLTSTSFFPYEHEHLKHRVPGLTVRTPEGELAPFDAPFLNTGSKDCFGGHGLYATMSDYLKIQHSILANDGKLLKPQTVDLMFQPQLSTESAQGLKNFMQTPMAAMFIGEYKPDIELNWGIGGILFMQDDVGRRKKYTLSWGGMSNPFWLIDREAGLALTFGTQVLPPGDKPTEEMITATELAVYQMAGVK